MHIYLAIYFIPPLHSGHQSICPSLHHTAHQSLSIPPTLHISLSLHPLDLHINISPSCICTAVYLSILPTLYRSLSLHLPDLHISLSLHPNLYTLVYLSIFPTLHITPISPTPIYT